MGQGYRFYCSNCKYEAEVSGGRDIGFVAVVRTMTCDDCHELADVLIGRQGIDGPSGDPEYDKDLNLCPHCSGSNVRPWTRKHFCPKCGAEMTKDESSHICWD